MEAANASLQQQQRGVAEGGGLQMAQQQPWNNRSGSVSSLASATNYPEQFAQNAGRGGGIDDNNNDNNNNNMTINKRQAGDQHRREEEVEKIAMTTASVIEENQRHATMERNQQAAFTITKTELTSYRDDEPKEQVTMGTNTEEAAAAPVKPLPKRRTSVENKKSEETQTSDNDSEVEENNSRVVNQLVREQLGTGRNGGGTKTRRDSESSNGSTYRKSVSFDLDGESNRRPSNYYSGGSDAENDVFQRAAGGQRKGILRSPSPFLDREPPRQLVTFGERRGVIDTEIERENPFRKEFFGPREEEEEKPKPRPVSVYEPESPPWSFEKIKQKMENMSRSTADLQQQQQKEQEANAFKRQMEGAKSLGQLNAPSRGPKPPRPPKPLHIKRANLVYNEGIEDINKRMFQGGFVEFEHDARTNTIKEVQRPFSPEVATLPTPPVVSPTPSSTSSMDSSTNSMRRSVERPKERPPPPPVGAPPPPPSKKRYSQEFGFFESLPLPQTPVYRHENSKVNFVVTQEEHRRIMLQENELRNSLQTDLNLVGLPSASGAGVVVVQDSDTESYLSSIAPEFSPVSTLQRSMSPLKLFPNVEKVPVHLRDLPSPQHPSYLRPKRVEEGFGGGEEAQKSTGVGCKCKDTVSGKEKEEEEDDEDDEDDEDGIDIDKYLPKSYGGGNGNDNNNNNNNYYTTATFSTFSGKETQV